MSNDGCSPKLAQPVGLPTDPAATVACNWNSLPSFASERTSGSAAKSQARYGVGGNERNPCVCVGVGRLLESTNE
jgi:hypothetical protein